MVLAILLFTVMDTLGKDVTGRHPVVQVVWARYFFQFALMLLLIPRVGMRELVRTARPGTPMLRCLVLAAATLCLIGAISFVPLAEALFAARR
jgi:drug/metabolite transporter (DMT)-like permease